MEGIRLRESAGKGRKTLSLTLSGKVFSLVSHMFNETVTGHYSGLHEITTCGVKGYKWTLNAYRLTTIVDGAPVHFYEIYGSCGDSSFGNSPFYFARKYSGNIRAARVLYNRFVDYVEKNHPMLTGKKFGI